MTLSRRGIEKPDIEALVREMPARAVPRSLRARVLAAASPLIGPTPTMCARIWYSRRWRMAVVGLAMLLLSVEAWSAVDWRGANDGDLFNGGTTAQARRSAESLGVEGSGQRAFQARLELALAARRKYLEDREAGSSAP